MRADRSLTPSRAAIASMPSTLPEIISSSHRRPLAMADRSFLLASARIGLAPLADSLDGRMTSRLRRKVCGDHGIAITLEGRSEASRSRISIDREPMVILSTSAASISASSAASASRLWTQQLGRWRAGLRLNLLRRRQGADGVEDDPLDSFRRDPRERSGFFLPTLVQNGRDIIAVAHSLLDGVARRHRVAPIVEQLAHEQGVGALTPQASPPTIFGQLGLNRFEQSRVDDRRVLAGIALVAMVDLADVHSIAQHMGQWPIGESSAADCAAGGKRSLSGDDPPLAQVPLQRRQRSKVEIAREDQPHRRRFFLVDDQFAVPDFVAQWEPRRRPKGPFSSMRRSCRGCARR